MEATDANPTIELAVAELRAVTAYAVACAESTLSIFERDCPGDPRAGNVLDLARGFAAGGTRTQALRMAASAAHRAARAVRESGHEAAADAARAAGHAGGAAYLHPLAKATQVWHILGAAAHTARACELDAGGDRAVGADCIDTMRALAGPVVVDVLARYPHAPNGGHRVGELLRALDTSLRRPATDVSRA